MSKTRDNHYVPQWHQEGFFEHGRSSIAYLDLNPERKILPDGRVITQNFVWNSTPTSRAFVQKDLYSTFFGTSINDEIERRLFGDIDGRGSQAVRAFSGVDERDWHTYFEAFFEFIDIQKIRTPKGLDWLKTQYPKLSQNELMMEMQGIRKMHCTIWSGGVREIVSAENSDVKFIISDHPVTVYNYAAPPAHSLNAYPLDPSIALKASQTIFPLNRDLCLIISNLEYARDPSTNPLEKRTFARNYRPSIGRTDAFIRTRKLTAEQVTQINFIMKSRARRYVGGGHKEWLYPEKNFSDSWSDLRKTLLPPREGLSKFGGEIFARYTSGHVIYQDEFGRTEKPRDFLIKAAPRKRLRASDACGCGSGRAFSACCQLKPEGERPAWNERSIRERNIILQNGIIDILGLDSEKDWVQIRRDITDVDIKDIYSLYETLWPLEADLLALLPKPDGVARAVYTGSIHPSSIVRFALAAPLYFGELIVAHPFIHSGAVAKEYRPTENPGRYRQEFLKSIISFMAVMPLVQLGLVNLIPDPCDFDIHLRKQMLRMAQARSSQVSLDTSKEARLMEQMEQDSLRILMSLPPDVLASQLRRSVQDIGEDTIENTLRLLERQREQDPLAVLQVSGSGQEKVGQLNLFKLAPNFEITMYLAKATGSCIVTDSSTRWSELRRIIRDQAEFATPGLAKLSKEIRVEEFAFPQSVVDIVKYSMLKTCAGYPILMRDMFNYLLRLEERGMKINREAQFAGRFKKIHAAAQATLKKSGVESRRGRISCVMPSSGLQDNTINRLLLMSSSERHLSSVPMAFLIEDYEIVG